MELFAIALFLLTLVCSILFHFSILIALVIGLGIFVIFALYRGFRIIEITEMIRNGIGKACGILITILLIGIMTALWRSAGTLPTIVSYSSGLLTPKIMILIIFLLNCMVSFLTGTAFGTGATMGVICASVASSMNISPVLTDGAILSGCLFGDRCSPVSTSMLLTAELTGTDPYDNIKTMLKTALIPFVITCVVFTVLGFVVSNNGTQMDLNNVFSAEFKIRPITLLPALIIILLSAFRVNVRVVMLISIGISIPISIFLQEIPLPEILYSMIFGFSAKTSEIAALIDGGGVISMLKPLGIICISSAYAGIFEKTALLSGIQKYVEWLANKTNGFTATLLTSVVTSMAACNQTLSIMLTHQLCAKVCKDNRTFASWIENTAVLIAPLVPWSIAGSTVLYSCGLPITGISAACYLYLVPLYNLILQFIFSKNNKTKYV